VPGAGASLGSAWIEVTADASGVAAALQGDVEDAVKTIAAGFGDAFAGVEKDSETAAAAVGRSLSDGASGGVAKVSAAVNSLATDATGAAGRIAGAFDGAFGKVTADADQAGHAVEESLGKGAADGSKKMADVDGGGFIDKIKSIAALAAASFGAAFVIDSYLDFSTAGAKLDAQMGAFGANAGQAGKVAGSIYADNFGESIDEVGDAVVKVSQGLGLAIDSPQLKSATEGVLNLSAAFGVDLAGATNSVAQLMRTGLAPDAQAALDIITVGMQTGANQTDDYLDTLNEYSGQFQKLGIDGATATGLLVQGLQAGARNTDLVADAFKEFSIRAIDGSTTTAAGFASIGLNAGDMAKQIGAGGDTAAAALEKTITSLRDMKDPVARSQAAVALFGTQAEDLGSALFALDPATAGAVGFLDDTKGAAEDLGNTLSDTAAAKVETLKRGLQTLAVDAVGGLITGFTDGKASGEGLAGTMSSLGAAVRDVSNWLGEHKGVLEAVAGVVSVVLLPVLAAWGVAAAVNAAANVAAWLSVAFTAGGSAAAQEASAAQVGLSWLAMGARAVVQGVVIAAVWTAQIVGAAVTGAASFAVQAAQVVAGWVLMAAQALAQGLAVAAVWTAQVVASAVTGAAGFAVQVAQVVAGWALMAAQALVQGVAMAAVWTAQVVASAVTGAAGFAVQVAQVVAGWALMAAQALVQGVAMAAVWTAQVVASAVTGTIAFAVSVAEIVGGWLLMAAGAMANAVIMAAAWFIALGPVGWVIAAVIGLVALIILNWDRVKSFTVEAFNAIVSAVTGAFRWIVDTVSTGVSNVIGFVAGLPGRILSALSGFATLLVGVGGDLMRGLVNGIAGAASFVGNVAKNVVNAIIRFINSNLINGLNGMLDFTIAGVHINVPDIPHIPALAEGYVTTRPMLALVGEAGPEAVVPLAPGKAAARAAVLNSAGLAGGTTYITYAPEVVIPKQATAAEAVALMRKDLSRSLRLGLLDGDLGSLEAVS
jgi:hypothetical protein